MFPRYKRTRLSTSARAELHARVLARQQRDGVGGDWPLCNICGMAIGPGRDWHESHMPAPHAITGAPGIAHVRCNLRRAGEHDAPLIAKTARQRNSAIGAKTPRNALPFGRNDPRKRTMTGMIVATLHLATPPASARVGAES
jgi:hypothetical protein